MEVKPGYKKTEVGMIPVDWAASKLGMHATFKTGPFGSALHRSDYVHDGIPVINPMQIVDGNIQPTPTMAITEQRAKNLSEFRLLAGSVIIGRRGEMGRCALVRTEEQGWLCGTGSMMILTGRSLDAGFAQRVLSSQPIITEIENASVGSTMVNLNQGTLGNLLFPLPPTKDEQRAIAEALSNADALIESLKHLLTKKRQIKKGAMQELLTGKKRLPGFKGEWDFRPLGHALRVRHGRSQKNVACPDGKYPIFGSGGEIGRADSFLYDKPSVLIGRKGTIDYPQFASSPFWTIDTLFYTEIAHEMSAKFLFYKFCTIPWRSYNEASGVPSLNARTIENIEVRLPKADEQTAIATILSDKDEEIATLEAKLSKARQLKQGMMQELLTGRIRLL